MFIQVVNKPLPLYISSPPPKKFIHLIKLPKAEGIFFDNLYNLHSSQELLRS